MKVKKERLLGVSLLIFIVLMPFGYKLNGRFAISNIGQIVSFLIVVPVIIKKMEKKYLLYNISSIVLMLFGAGQAAIHYNISMHLGHIAFFTLINLYVSFFVFETKHNEIMVTKLINNAVKISGYLFVVPYSIMGIYEIIFLRKAYSSYLFDDKSHAVLFFAFYAFAILKLMDRKGKYFLSAIYFILSLTTTSRLGIIFIPFYILACYSDFQKQGKSLLKKMIYSLVIVFLVAVMIVIVYNNIRYFSVFGRLNTSRGSTMAHIVLITYSIKIKFSNPLNFLLGTGPGSFSNILVASRMDLSGIKSDVASYYAILLGTLPVHSSHFELLMDFSIGAFFIYVRFLFKIFKRMIKNQAKIDLLFFIAFMGAEFFYSTFHEGLFYVILLYLFAGSIDTREEEYASSTYIGT